MTKITSVEPKPSIFSRLWAAEKKRTKESMEKDMPAWQVWGTVLGIIVMITLVVNSFTSDTFDDTKAIQICTSDLRSRYGQNVDVHHLRTTTLEKEDSVIVLIHATKENMYGGEVRLSHICHIDKVTNAVTKTEPGLPW